MRRAAIVAIMLLCASCTTPAAHTTKLGELTINVVCSASELPCGSHGCANAREVWIVGGTDSDGRLVVPDAVLGHEMRHVLEKNDSAWREPDSDWAYRVYKFFARGAR